MSKLNNDNSSGASIAVFNKNEVLLVKRSKPPFKGMWSLPGGSIKLGEKTEETAIRELKEETSLRASQLKFVMQFSPLINTNQNCGDINIRIDVYATQTFDGIECAGDDASALKWCKIEELGQVNLTPLANEIIQKAHSMLFT